VEITDPLLFESTGARKPAYYGALSGLRICARTVTLMDERLLLVWSPRLQGG
jgi:hypothetical protein